MGHLFVIPARDVSLAVILRRGPSKWYHVILWETRRDEFTHGAWFKGRIYEEKCDLSPDGKLFVYFVHQGSRVGTVFTDAWTAISRPPWLQALVLWPQGTTYGGGGKFMAPRTLSGPPARWTHPDFPLPEGRLQFTDQLPEPKPPSTVVPDADWSGHDQAGHVIFSRGHQLFRRRKDQDLLVVDFSDLKPDPAPAPEWATRPL